MLGNQGNFYEHPYTTDEITRKYCIEQMSDSELETYVDMLQSFGFNSIQIGDLRQYYIVGKLSDPSLWRHKVLHIAEYARSKGMRMTLFVWGNSAYDYRDNSFHPKCNWYDPKERGVLEQYYDYQASYAPYVDHFITHWGDPGGCTEAGNTIETAQELHNILLSKFQKSNPEIESTFSLWMLHSRRFCKWAGYKDENTILRAGILPSEVMLALHGRFNKKQAKNIKAKGRGVGVWAWYLADQEVRPSLHVHHKQLGKYFSELPRDAGKLLDWHSLESNCHKINIWNLYVGAQLMLNPYQSAEGLLRDFVEKVFGKKCVDEVLGAFEAIAATRCIKDYDFRAPDALEGGDPVALLYSIPPQFDHPKDDIELLEEAQKNLESVHIDPERQPPFPLIITPLEIVDELKIHLETLRDFAQFRMAVAKGLNNLPLMSKPTKFVTELEYLFYEQMLNRL